MKNEFGNRPDRIIQIRRQLTTTLLLWSFFLVVFPVSIFSTDKGAAQGLIYCPLSKRLQPINSRSLKKEVKPFDFMCGSAKTKDYLFQEIVLKNPWKVFTLDANGIEKLVFDVLGHGKTALEKLPGGPNAPSEKSLRQIGSAVSFNRSNDYKYVWKRSATDFSPGLAPRPPTAAANSAVFFPIDLTDRSAALSRRTPRAPPSFS